MLLTCLQPDIQETPTLLKPHFPPALSFLPLHTYLYSPLSTLLASLPTLPLLPPLASFHLSSSLQSCCETHQRWQSVFLRLLQGKDFSTRVSTKLQAESSFFEQINARPATEEGNMWLYSNSIR